MENPLILYALLLGLGTSLHCVGMCGPIAFSLGLNNKKNYKFAGKNLLYQFGRVTTYTLLGAVFGLIGESFELAGLQRYLSIVAGLFMIFMVLIPRNLSKINWGKGVLSKLLVKLKVALGSWLQNKSTIALYITGILNGLLPCGPVYVALTASLAVGSLWFGILFMLLFGLGTMPLMFLTVYSGSVVGASFRKKILKVLPMITAILGLFFVLRGLGLNIPLVSPPADALELNAKANCH